MLGCVVILSVVAASGASPIGFQKAPDGRTAGWLVESRIDGVTYPIASTLVVRRAGRIVRRFVSGQVFYSWSFYADGNQVAYHAGPLHGERRSHCELHDISSGRLLATWDGDLDSPPGGRPGWTGGLTH